MTSTNENDFQFEAEMSGMSVKFVKIFVIICGIFYYLTINYSWLYSSEVQTDSTAENIQNQFDSQRIFTQITTHPEIDIAPSVSRDGKWIAFTSKRSGNFDIWVKAVKGGRVFQITTHKADDASPCWHPDGDKLYFVSLSEDAAGDLWQIELDFRKDGIYPDSRPQKLTQYLGRDDFPKVSPDGKKIAFVSNRSGREEIWIYYIKTGKVRQLTFRGGTHPAWSADGEWVAFTSFRRGPQAGGNLFVLRTSDKTIQTSIHAGDDQAIALTQGYELDGFPCWSPKGYVIVFSRIGLDFDQDGVLTPNDQSSLWMLDATLILQRAQGKQSLFDFSQITSHQPEVIPAAFPLTQWGQNHSLPFWDTNNHIFFNSYTRSGWDIFMVSKDGPLPTVESASRQFLWINQTFPFPKPGIPFNKSYFLQKSIVSDTTSTAIQQILFLRLLALMQLIEFFPDAKSTRAWALYEIGRTYNALNYPSTANTYFNQVLRHYPDQKHVCGFAEIARVESRVKEFGTDFLESRKVEFGTDVEIYQKILEKYKGYPSPSARAEIILADLLTVAGQQIQALDIYQNFFKKYPQLRSECAEVQLKIGQFFGQFGQLDAERQAYLKVLLDYADQEDWINRAIQHILSFERSEIDTIKLIQKYQEIIDNYPDYPALAATAQLGIGRVFFMQNDLENAFNELQRVEQNYGRQRELIVQAQMLIAEIYLNWEDAFKAFEIYDKIRHQDADLRDGYYARQATSKLLHELLDSAERLKNRDIKLALGRFTRARSIQPNNIQAHRGVIFCCYLLRQIDDAINYYRLAVQREPENEVLLYSSGLCYSYKAVEKAELDNKRTQIDIHYINLSNDALNEALSHDYRLTQAYLTLSANYELLEKYETSQRNKPKSFLRRASTSIIAPIITLVKFVFRIEEKQSSRWYEKGIDLLTTAIALNNENQDPKNEALLAQQLANLYYHLKEFGYASAYRHYRYRITLDSTFVSKEQEAFIYTRLGHCALYVEDFEDGPKYLKRAIQLYQELAQFYKESEKKELANRTENLIFINMTRLALLYQIAGNSERSGDYEISGNYELSVEYFKDAVKLKKQQKIPPEKKLTELEKLYRNIAYNSQLLEEEEEALWYAKEALRSLEKDRLERVNPRANWLKIGILGWNIPIWNAKNIGIGQSTASEGFTTDEEFAMIYSIMEKTHANTHRLQHAIHYAKKKLHIYRKLENKQAEAIIQNNIGILYYLIGDFQQAWQRFESSFRLCDKAEFYDGALINIIDLAALALTLNRSGCERQIVSIDSSKKPPVVQPIETIEIATKHIVQGLEYYSIEDIILNPEFKIQLYNLLANIHIVNARNELSASKQALKNVNADAWFNALDEFMLADSCYGMALQIANKLENKHQAAILYLNRGLLFLYLNEWQPASKELKKCLVLARKINFISLLWRIDHVLGNFIWRIGQEAAEEFGFTQTADDFFEAGIEIVEANVLAEQRVKIPMIYLQDIRPLYEDAIAYYSDVGDYEEALYLSECLRSRIFLGNMARKNLKLKSQYHENYWRLAQFLQEEIDKLETEIRYLEYTRTKKVDKKLNQKRENLVKNQAEYSEVQDKMKLEDPELESMVRVNPPAYQNIRRMLPDSTIVINYLVTDNQLFIWSLDNESLIQKQIDVNRKELRDLTHQFFRGITHSEITSDSAQFAIEKLSQVLIVPLEEAFTNANQLIFIPDDCLCLLPFVFLYNVNREATFDKIISVVPSLSNYYYCYLKRKISGGKIGITSDDQLLSVLSEAGYEAENLLSSQSKLDYEEVEKRIENSFMLHLSGQIEWNQFDANASIIRFRDNPTSKIQLNLSDIFSWLLKSNLVIFNVNTPNDILIDNSIPFSYLQRIFFYAGTPTLIMTLWPIDESIRHEFYGYFYEYLLEAPAGKALMMAQNQMKKLHPEIRHWAGFQLFGFVGMTAEEETQFAIERFALNVAKGNDAYRKQEWQDAIRYYESALMMAETQGDFESISRLQARIIETGFIGRNFNKAIEYQEKLLAEAEAIDDIEAMKNGYYNLITFHTENNNFEASLKYQSKYAELVRAHGFKHEEAESYIQLGQVHELAGNYELAIKAYQEAIRRHQTIGDSLKVAIALKYIGRVHLLSVHDYKSAINYQEQALTLFKREKDSKNTIATLHDMGLSYERRANYRRAFSYQNEALELSQSIKDSLMLGLSFQNLANLSWKTGDYQTALSYLRKAMDIFLIFNHQRYLEIAYSTLGLIYMSLGRIEDALQAENNALQITKNIDAQLEQATIYKNIGLIYDAEGDQVQALENFQKAAAIDAALKYKRGLAYDYRNLGRIYLQIGNVRPALIHLTDALNLSTEISDRRNEAQCLYELSRVFQAQTKLDSALILAKHAAQNAEYLMIPELNWRARRICAQIYEQLGKIDSSLVCLEEATSIIESMRSQLKVEEYKSGFIDDKLDVYYDMIHLLLEKMNQPDQALEAAERAKSRNFIDMLANRNIKYKSAAAVQLTAQKDSLTQLIADVQNEIAFLRSKAELSLNDREQLTTAEKKLAAHKKNYETLLVRIQEENPELADLVSVNPLNARQIQQMLPNETILLEYILTKHNIVIWSVSPENIKAQMLKFPLDSLQGIVKRFRDRISRHFSIENEAKQLYSILIRPIEDNLNDDQHLIIIPHGILHYVPFAALMHNKNQYLLDKYTLSLAPSSTVLEHCLQKGQIYVDNPRWERRALALGNPELNDPEMELIFAEQEIRSLKRVYPQVEAFLEHEATETIFKQKGLQNNIIVFSCHGEYDERNPLFSALLLAGDTQNTGRLESHEIFGLNLNAYLVTMSACETGLGSIVGGDEVIGLSRSFIFAGASSLMASLWKVDDLATAVLIKRFFRYLNEGHTRSQALRLAQLLVRKEINVHPAYWAAFNIIGDCR